MKKTENTPNGIGLKPNATYTCLKPSENKAISVDRSAWTLQAVHHGDVSVSSISFDRFFSW